MKNYQKTKNFLTKNNVTKSTMKLVDEKECIHLLSNLNIEVTVGNKEEEIEKATHIFLPGVGTYANVIKNTNKFINIPLLKNQIILKKKPILGICVGMQIMASQSEEGVLSGLNWIEGKVLKLDKDIILPHMGWNNVKLSNKSDL